MYFRKEWILLKHSFYLNLTIKLSSFASLILMTLLHYEGPVLHSG